jgi:hypothetical protein
MIDIQAVVREIADNSDCESILDAQCAINEAIAHPAIRAHIVAEELARVKAELQTVRAALSDAGWQRDYARGTNV